MLNLTMRILGKSMTGSATSKTLGDLGKIDRALVTVSQRLKRVGRSMRNIGASLTAGVTAPLAFLARDSLRLYDTQLRAETAVATALKSTGNAANFQLGELKALASERQRLTTLGDEEILLNVTAPLLSFTQIKKDFGIFEDAQAVTLDLATLMQTDLKSAALQVGKALNDPIAGLGGLSRAGIQFSDDQKKVIKALVETGKIAEAQRLILNELQTQFGGQAAALASTPLGKITQLSNAWGDLKEQFGEQIAPALTPLVKGLTSAVDWFSKLNPETKKTITIIAGVTAVVGPLTGALGLLAIGIGGLVAVSAPIWGVVGVVAALAAGAVAIYANWDGVKAWFADLWAGIHSGVVAGWDLIKAALNEYLPDWYKNAWWTVASAFANIWEVVRLGVVLGWDLIKGLLDGTYSPTQLIYAAWKGVGAWFREKWEDVSAAFSELWATIKLEVDQWPIRMKNYGVQMIEGLVAGLVQNIFQATGAMDKVYEGTANKLEELYGIKSPSRVFMGIGENMMAGLRVGVENGLPAVSNVMTTVANSAAKPLQNSPITDLLVGLINKTTTFKDYFLNAMKEAGNSLLKFALNSAWNKLFSNFDQLGGAQFGGGLSGGLAGLISGFIGNIFGGGAKSTASPTPYAKGGIVGSAMAFSPKSGILGEAGPEAILPLTRVGGSLGVKAISGESGGPGEVHYHFHIDATGAQDPAATEAAIMRGVSKAQGQMKEIAAKVSAAVYSDNRRRGV